MEIRNSQTGPLTSPTQEASLPPELAGLASQLSPQARQGLNSLYQSDAAAILNPTTEAGARGLKAYYHDLAKSAPTKELAQLFEAAAKTVMTPEQRRALAESMREAQDAVRKLIAAQQQLADEMLRSKLQGIRVEDLQAAQDLLAAAGRDEQARQADRLTAEQLMAVGLVTAIAVPAVSQSKLEGVTSSSLARRQTQTDTKVDERMKKDALETDRGMASELRLEDLSGPARRP